MGEDEGGEGRKEEGRREGEGVNGRMQVWRRKEGWKEIKKRRERREVRRERRE